VKCAFTVCYSCKLYVHMIDWYATAKQRFQNTKKANQDEERQGESVTLREEALEYFTDPVPPTKKPRPPPSTDTLDYLKKLVSLEPQDFEERSARGS
jgi:hypothetical protein